MGNDKYPQEPWRRRCLMIVDPQTYRRMPFEAPEIASHQEVYVVDISSVDPAKVPFEIMGNPPIKPGILLVQSPYLDSVYADVVEAEERFAVAKHMSFCTFVGLLGAKKVTVKQVEISTKDSSLKIDTTANDGLATGKAGALYEEWQKIKNDVTLVREFKGSLPDLARAEQFLRERNLTGESKMRALIDSAKFSQNPMKSAELTMNLSNDSSSNLKLAASLDAQMGSVSLDLNRKTKNSFQYTLTVQVEFPEES